MNESELLQLKDFYVQEVTSDDIVIQLNSVNRTVNLAKTIGAEQTRSFILPLIESLALETINDEVMIAIAGQLQFLSPFVGSIENTVQLLHILTNFTTSDEALVRTSIVDAIAQITSSYTTDMMDNVVLPIITGLITKDWIFSKWTGLLVVTKTYQRFNDEDKNEILKLIVGCFYDSLNPMARKQAAECLQEIMDHLSKETIINEIVPVVYQLLIDSVDQVLVTSIPLCVAISKRLDTDEVLLHIRPFIEKLKLQNSWKIDAILAMNITDLLQMSEGEEHLTYTYKLFIELIAHKELEVQIQAAEGIFNFFKAVRDNFLKRNSDFEEFFQKEFGLFEAIMFEAETDVKVVFSKQIVAFVNIISVDLFKTKLLPLILNWLQCEEKMNIQENILLNFDNMPTTCIDVEEVSNVLINVIKNMILKSHLQWRTRRNLVIAFVYLSKYLSKEMFDQKFKIFYSRLIGDKVFAVRRTATLILPILAKNYGIDWLSNTVVPYYMVLTGDHRYLYAYMPLFCINELIFPSLEEQTIDAKADSYLRDYKNQLEKTEVLHSLYKINKLFAKIKAQLEQETIMNLLVMDLAKYPSKCDFELYAEDTFPVLKNNYTSNLTLTNKLDCTYLEGILILIQRDFLGCVIKISQSTTENLRIFAKHTMKNMKKFLEKLNNEINQPWVKDALGKIASEDAEKLGKEIDEKLARRFEPEKDELDTLDAAEDLPLSRSSISENNLKYSILMTNSDLKSTKFMNDDNWNWEDFAYVDKGANEESKQIDEVPNKPVIDAPIAEKDTSETNEANNEQKEDDADTNLDTNETKEPFTDAIMKKESSVSKDTSETIEEEQKDNVQEITTSSENENDEVAQKIEGPKPSEDIKNKELETNEEAEAKTEAKNDEVTKEEPQEASETIISSKQGIETGAETIDKN